MSLLRRDVSGAGLPVLDRRTGRNLPGLAPRGASAALRQSVIWASMSLRAATESLMPVDVKRMIGGVAVDVEPQPAFFRAPSNFSEGHDDTISDWLYAGRMNLDGHGNNFGEIVGRDAFGLPSRIQLVPPEDVRCRVSRYRIVEYRFGNLVMDPRDVWHERQHLIGGLPVGLSPFAYAALTIDMGQAGREFAAEWFGNKAVPSAHLKNVEKTVSDKASDAIKARFEASMSSGGVFVTGKDWTYSPLQAKAAESGLLEAMNWNAVELVRFFNVMPELVAVGVESGASLTYSNITQANLQFLVRHMARSIKAREDALTAILPKPRFVKLNRSAFLAMDPLARAQLMETKIRARMLTPDQARGIDDELPLSEVDYAQFDRLFGNPNKSTPQKAEA